MIVVLLAFFIFSVGCKRKISPGLEEVTVKTKIKKEDLALETMIDIEEHLIEEKRFVEFTRKVSYFK